MYNTIKKKLQEAGSESNIIAIFKTGSQLFIDNPNDLDYIVVVENYEQPEGHFIWREDGKRYDVFVRDIIYIKESLKFSLINPSEDMWKKWLYNYFYAIDIDVVYGTFDFKWNIFDFKEEYMAYIKAQYPSSIGKRINKTTLTKGWVHYYIILKIYENNSIAISDEMKQDIMMLYSDDPGSVDIITWIESKI